MNGFIRGEARTQATLLPEILDDYITEDNAVRAIDVFNNEIMALNFLGWDIKQPLKLPGDQLIILRP